MLDDLKNSPFKALAALGKTFCQWKEEIVRMWRFRKSNDITEGFHRKMKLSHSQFIISLFYISFF
ncbi:TPA: transposase [Legionella pneumophila]|nr:transposase [Legionella pneumophila]MCO1452091.1 transposase [Legionella pneumophila]MCZ4721505.1 transposase [Legionella pneumophila]MCZ4729289.1 transposase [Legionella pneumophila]MCZ4734583.1 transposase [Legionella pneumophila]MDI0457608.1 transposase [Legionella pneumophila]